jgi:Peroxiredoxin
MNRSLLIAALMVGNCAAQGPPVQASAEAYKALPSEVRDGKLKPGDPAMDFTLKIRHSGKTVRLSRHKGKRPVALVFGSYT